MIKPMSPETLDKTDLTHLQLRKLNLVLILDDE